MFNARIAPATMAIASAAFHLLEKFAFIVCILRYSYLFIANRRKKANLPEIFLFVALDFSFFFAICG